ncbi:hypothetical protein [Croceitalea dokdonensis]|nr:hypothetical protein [Croceitalea dokdonensis]
MLVCLGSCDSAQNDDEFSIGQSNTLSYQGKSFSYDKGLVLNRGTSGNHYNIDFKITDGVFTAVDIYIGFIPYTYWYFGGETVRLDLELYAPGRARFSPGSFTYTPLSEDDIGDAPNLAGEFLFLDSEIGLDLNGDGEVDTDTGSELFDITDVTITVDEVFPNFKIGFDLELENGQSVSGNYEAEFTVWPID